MLQNIYLNLPRTAQNMSLSIFGAKLYKERFSGNIPKEYEGDLILLNNFTPEDFAAQAARLRELISYCKHHVPFYQKYLRNVDTSKILPTDINNILPIITKADILANKDEFISNQEGVRHQLKTANTSGSSGTPLSIKYTDESRRINYAIYNAALKQFGCHYRSKSTTLAGRILYKSPKTHPDRYDFFNKTQYISSYFISDENIKYYVDALNSWKPEFIDTYPSAIVELIKLANYRGLKFDFKPKVVLTSSENLSNEARTLIESTFETKVLDHYGCTEMAINAFSSGDKYYANPRFSVIETKNVFDTYYEVITTGLLNFGMPLLRYKIGDIVCKETTEGNYVFTSIDGRLDDIIITPEGRKVGRMDPAFKGIDGIANAQIVQESFHEITVFVVLNHENSIAFRADLLIQNIKERTSSSIDVKIEYVEKIEKGSNGKFKSVVSKIKK
ncbi:phenylacetate--CoA ligase family protein [Cellvibrio sp. pealriver]|uniref:phenylacetate--CoA ligase family protein n=1 Tax=Cellvibrio sp. pealriver TaxID=1622269 RepID=UPI00066FFDBE|nr:phenylacetate--CoA ligase family protein [Cellvibrio sp. pealriver]